jgi:hypothetical protein
MSHFFCRVRLSWFVLPMSFLFTDLVYSQDWKAAASFNYETGDFGTGQDTTTIYLPFTLTRYWDKGDLSLTVPYLYQETSSLVTTVSGVPTRIRKQTTTQTVTTTSHDGFGDLIFRGHYYLLEEFRKDPIDVSLVGKIKLPTADTDEGLGTGEFDEGLGIEINKQLTKQWSVFSDLSFTLIGDPPGTDLNDQIAFDLGVGYRIIDPLTLSASYEYRNALVDDAEDPQDLTFSADYKITKTVKVFFGLLAGLTDGSPDVGVNFGSSVRF